MATMAMTGAAADRLRKLDSLRTNKRASFGTTNDLKVGDKKTASRIYSIAVSDTKHLKQEKYERQQRISRKVHEINKAKQEYIVKQTAADQQAPDDAKEEIPLSPMHGRQAKPPQTEPKVAKSQSPIPKEVNPTVESQKDASKDGSNNKNNIDNASTNDDSRGSIIGGIKSIFRHKSNSRKNSNATNAPKKMVFSLKAKGGSTEKFELYSWLKPLKILGEGAYAAVCEVEDTRSKKKYAVKKNRDVFANVSDARRILREIKLMIHFDHPHVMSICGVIPPEKHERDSYKDVYLMMDKCDTTLSKVIRSKQKLSERHIQYFVYQIARGLEYMHSGGIIHRDLKPENVLVNAGDCKVKITDFGLARGVRIDIDSPQKLTEYVVTRWYRAPEVMCCSRLYDSQIDTWSLGCITAELFTRRPIFKGRNHIEQLQLIFHFMGTPKDLDWITTADAKKWIAGMQKKPPQDLKKTLPNSSANAQDFVKQLLTLNPHERPNITQAIKHVWMKEFARDKDYKKCPTFNISFEYEASIKTGFGVRHMMFEELNNYHRACVKKEQDRMERRKARKAAEAAKKADK